MSPRSTAETDLKDALADLFRDAYPLARRVAEVRSAAAIRALAAMGFDRADLEQELLLAVWQKLRYFDPVRAALPTFIEKVCSTKSTSIFRRGKAAKRTPPISNTGRRGALDVGFTAEIHVDVRRALKTLDRYDQNVARLLLTHLKPAEIARILGTSRAGVYRSIERLRAALKGFDLEKY